MNEIKCQRCGEDIRFVDGAWLDRETHSDCQVAESQSAQSEDEILVRKLTAIAREADEHFLRVGGSTLHWTRECFLPLLNKRGWIVAWGVRHAPPDGISPPP